MSTTRPDAETEKARQNGYAWARSQLFSDYNAVLGYYQVQASLEHARGVTALDLACGDGLLTARFAAHFERIVGVDASARHLSQARQRLPDVEFHESLIETLHLGERFDTVLMLNILEHVEDPVLVLGKAAEHLQDDGVVIVHVPNAHAVNRRIAVLMGTLTDCEELSPFDLQVVGHRRSYHLASLQAEVTRAGLTVRAVGGVFYKALSTPQMDWFLRHAPWQEGGFGWGRVGAEPRDWKAEFCRACYEFGKQRPEDCNVVYVVATR